MTGRRARFSTRASVVVPFLLVLAGCSERPSATAPQSPAANAGGASSVQASVGFVPLHLEDFEIFQGKVRPSVPTWTEENSVLHSTGKPRGYLYTKRSYKNFTLRAALRFPMATPADSPKANTGFLLFIQEPHHVWPVCVEVQGKHLEMGTIKGNGRPNPLDPSNVHDDEPARKKALRDPAEWNHVEITVKDGRATSFLNGTKICEMEPCSLRDGPIGLQAEDWSFEVRGLEIRDDSPQRDEPRK